MLREALFLPLANRLPRFRAFDRLRPLLLRLAGIQIGSRATIWAPLIVRPIGGARNISVGRGSFINTHARFGVPVERVIIGQNVQVGPFVCFETVTHGVRYVPGVGRGDFHAEIVIEDEVWIGAGAIILGGVTIGRGSVVAAGAVVTSSVAAATIVGGVPSKIIRLIQDSD